METKIKTAATAALGTFFGAAVTGALLNGLTIQNLPYYNFDIDKGDVLVAALGVTYVYAKNKSVKS